MKMEIVEMTFEEIITEIIEDDVVLINDEIKARRLVCYLLKKALWDSEPYSTSWH